jgi:hypothetical protein
VLKGTAAIVAVALSISPLAMAADIPVSRFARLALECVHQEYPNKIAHTLASDTDVAPPRELTPAFYGCFDWHSSVHGHWLLARLSHKYPDEDFVPEARTALAKNLTTINIEAEAKYVAGAGRETFERPYGLAWLLQLAAELHEWDDPDARRWSAALEPLEAVAAKRIADWLPKLTYPIRTGEHSQTAFAFGLILDWARVAGNTQLEELLKTRSLALYQDDKNCPLAYEPGGQDFLSPCLAEADLIRRILPSKEFAGWLSEFLPSIPETSSTDWLPIAQVSDRSDGKIAHLDGLNLSRAWMLEGIAAALPAGDNRIGAIDATGKSHRDAALAAVTGEHYEGGHWLGSFAVYLVTSRGL